jgi:long-subunit acyl-CoA synthetase (AMP-forming)
MAGESIGEALAQVADYELPLQSVYRWESERPDALYMVQPLDGGRVDEYAWRRTLDEARRLAAYLKGKGYAPGTTVALVTKNCAQHFIFEIAAWMAGCVTVSVYPTVDSETLGYILEHAECPLVFVGKLDAWPGMADGIPGSVEILTCELSPEVAGATRWQDVIRESEPMAESPIRGADETCMLIYTSGTTGKPKGAEHTFATSSVTARALHRLFRYSDDDRMLSYLPLAHVMERAIVFLPSLMFGFQVYFADSLETFVDDLKRARPTIFASVPRLWLKFKTGIERKLPPKRLKTLLRVPVVGSIVRRKVLRGLGLDAARITGTGAAPLPKEIHEWYRDLGLEFLDSLGMSELMGLATLARPGQSRPGTVGPALPGSKIRISAIGEIEVSSPSVMKGYYKQPELTAAAFTEDGWLKTGDQGDIDDEGLLRITGRVKELFKTGKGKYVAPAPIESMLNSTGLIEQSCVMGVGEPQPYAVVMLSEQAREALTTDGRDELLKSLESVLASVNDRTPSHERLAKLVVTADSWEIANGFLTPTMKLKRSVIEMCYDARAKALGPGVVAL